MVKKKHEPEPYVKKPGDPPESFAKMQELIDRVCKRLAEEEPKKKHEGKKHKRAS